MGDNFGTDTEVTKRNGNVTDELIAESAFLSDCEMKGCVQGHQRTGGEGGGEEGGNGKGTEREREKERERVYTYVAIIELSTLLIKLTENASAAAPFSATMFWYSEKPWLCTY